MARYEQGILGPFSGKVGTVVGSTWKGINTMRSKGKTTTKPATIRQQAQRMRFSVATDWLSPIRSWIDVGYKAFHMKMTPMNKAVSFHMKNALIVEDGNIRVDYKNAVLSRGELMPPCLPSAYMNESGTLIYNWQNNHPSAFSRGTDEAVMLVYNDLRDEFVWLRNAGERESGMCAMQLPESYTMASLHCWLSFVSTDGTLVSTSVYVMQG